MTLASGSWPHWVNVRKQGTMTDPCTEWTRLGLRSRLGRQHLHLVRLGGLDPPRQCISVRYSKGGAVAVGSAQVATSWTHHQRACPLQQMAFWLFPPLGAMPIQRDAHLDRPLSNWTR